MNKGISDENNTNRILIDLPKSYTPKKTKTAVCWKLLDEINVHDVWSWCSSYLKQQLTDIIESCRKVTPSDEDLFIKRQTKQKKIVKKSVRANSSISKQKNQNLPEWWVDQQTIGKKFTKKSISNEFTNQKDKKKSSVEEVPVNDCATYDKTSAIPIMWNTYILGVEDIVGSKKRITECITWSWKHCW